MDNGTRKILALTIVASMLLVGCTGEPSSDPDENDIDGLEQPTDPVDNSTDILRQTRLLKLEVVNSAMIPIISTACFHSLQAPSWMLTSPGIPDTA